MLPAELTPDHVYSKKREAYEKLATGSHWPNKEEWFRSPRRFNAAFEPQLFFSEPPILSERLQQLYGLQRYSDEDLQPKKKKKAEATASTASGGATGRPLQKRRKICIVGRSDRAMSKVKHESKEEIIKFGDEIDGQVVE